MSILDDAIREHLELKRQHGAPDDELKKLEDEAFGPPARPDELADPLAEAPTEFMTAPEMGAPEGAVEAPEAPAGPGAPAEGRRVPDIADLQEAPPAPAPEPSEPAEPEPPAEEEHPAMEHEIAELPVAAEPEIEDADTHTTQERHAIAEQPTEMFDVERELAADADEIAATEPAPTDEELLDTELEEPRLAAEPPTPAPSAPAFDEEDDFFDEQRLSDELDQALEAPAPAAPPTEEHDLEEEEEPVSEEYETVSDSDEEPSEEHNVFDHEEGHADALEDTPDFLEESPEDEQLWFEQKSPKDFDFGD